MRLRGWGLCLCVLAACTDESAAPDAGITDAEIAVSPVFDDPKSKVRFTWPHTWRRATAPSAPDDNGVLTLAKVERTRPNGSLVSPRLVLTLEPTTLEDADVAARRVKNVLEAQLGAAGAKVRRVSMSKRAVQGRLLTFMDLSYAVSAGQAAPTTIRHRSLLALGEFGQGSLAILTLTATYLGRDHDLVGPEVDAVFESLTLPLEAPAGEDREAPKVP